SFTGWVWCLYTPPVEQNTKLVTSRHRSRSRPVPVTLTSNVYCMSSSDPMATIAPAWKTWSKSVGRSSRGSRARSFATHVTPMASRAARAAGSPNRARPHTSLPVARARTIGRARWPAGPVTRIFLPSMAPHHSNGDDATVAAVVDHRDKRRDIVVGAADRFHHEHERTHQPGRHVVDVEAVDHRSRRA